MYRSILVSLSIFLLALSVSSNDSPIIRQTQNGPVKGIEQMSSLGQIYYSFRGIPFAESPITGIDPYTGEQVDRRFKAPEALKRQWTEALKVDYFGDQCTQRQDEDDASPYNLTKLGEDCLLLNIYVPANGSKQKTVLVYIYGGGFNYGESTDELLGPDFLLSQDNIVVTIQYRLGIFGFLNLNIGEYTGNMGLKDQQLALKWIHDNIEHFSGNKNEILLFGESSGSVSVQLQMLNKESRSYFTRAFAMSGSVFQSYVFTKANHVQRVQECSKFNETDKLIEYLKTENSSALMNCPQFRNIDIWVPVIESNKTKAAFLTKSPEEIFNDPTEEAPVMDIMFSFTSQEVVHITPNISEPLIKENVMETVDFELSFKGFNKTAHPKEYEQALRMLRKAYFSNTTNIAAIKRANADLLSGSLMNYAVIEATALQSKANQIGPKNTYLFRFNVTADLNLVNVLDEENFSDAVHTDDICYLFHCHIMDKTKQYDKHLENKDHNYDLIMRSVKMITNFARTGDPSIEGDTPFRPINSIDEMFCQEVGNTLKTSVTHDIREQIHYDVWHEIDEIYKSFEP